MKKLLVVVDMQKDFIDGVLGTKEAISIIPNVVRKIKSWDGDIACTIDTHDDNYLQTNEGKHLPVVHCVKDTDGWRVNRDVYLAICDKQPAHKCFYKNTFGSLRLMDFIKENKFDYIEFVGLCTDICVVSNAVLAKAFVPEVQIVVDASCCAGVTPESHGAALDTMKMCQIDVVEQ